MCRGSGDGLTALLCYFNAWKLWSDGRLYDPSLRAAAKAQKTAPELLETALPLKVAVEPIRKAKVEEQTQQQEEASGTATTGNAGKAPQPRADGANDHKEQINAALASGSMTMSLTPDADNCTMQFVAIARRKIAANVVLCSAVARSNQW